MKTAYELAMERLNASDPDAVENHSLTKQRAAVAEIGRRYQAKIAEREIFLNKQLQDAFARQKRPTRWRKIRRQLATKKSACRKRWKPPRKKSRNQQ